MKILQKVCLLRTVKKTVFFVDYCQFTLSTYATDLEHDFFVVIMFKVVFWFSIEVQTEKFTARHLLDVRIPDRGIEVEVERQFAAFEFLLTKSDFRDT